MIPLLLALQVATVAPVDPGAIDTLIDRLLPNRDRPGFALAVVKDGRTVYRRVLGYQDLGDRIAATPETRYEWASVSKQFTAYVIASLVQAGKLAPSDPVARYRPRLAGLGVPITVEQLLHHTGGIEDIDGLLTLAGVRWSDDVDFGDAIDLLERQRHLRFEPGSQHFYSNGGYALLAAIAEAASGDSFPALAKRLVFDPLGLVGASFRTDVDRAEPDIAVSYRADEGGVYRRSRYPEVPGPGGLVATIDDLARWAVHLLAPGADSARVAMLGQRGVVNGEPIGYAWGIGWGEHRGHRMLGHAGSGPGSSSQITLFPDLGLGLVAVSASSEDPGAGQIVMQVANLLLPPEQEPAAPSNGPRAVMLTTAMFRERPPETEGLERPAEELAALAGIYRLDEGRVVIRPAAGHLEMARDGSPPFFPIYPTRDGGWLMIPLYERLSFELDANGRGQAITLERTDRSLIQRGPRTRTGRRVDVPSDSTALAGLVGWYLSDELATLYQVRWRDGALRLWHPRHGELTLIVVDGTAFGIDSRLIARATFAKDQTGKGVGLLLEAFSWGVSTSFRRVELSP
ncbi:MAG: serine hydrolase domain-containing protein [Gemmatimonadales bacterium]